MNDDIYLFEEEQMNMRKQYIICNNINPTDTDEGDRLVTLSSVPFNSVPLDFLVLGLIAFEIHLIFYKQIQTDLIPDEVRLKKL